MNDLIDLTGSGDTADVDVRALAGRTTPEAPKPPNGRRALIVRIAISVLVGALAGGALWWHGAVTGEPGLEFYGGPNAYRDTASTDQSGITHKENLLGDEVDVAFVQGGRFYVSFGLYNGGHHDVRIEAVPPQSIYYWAFDRMSVGTDPDDGLVGMASHYKPFRPFTLHHGQTVEVRLEFRLADCDPKTLQPGGSSTLRGLPVRYHTLGISRTSNVPFDNAAIALQAMGTCAHPID